MRNRHIIRLKEWANNHSLFAYWIPVVIYMILIFYLSSISKPPTPPGTEEIKYFPELFHFIEYTILSFLIYMALNTVKNPLIHNHPNILAFSIAFIYGASDEVHQSFVPGRSATIEDFLIDGLGAIVIQIIIGIYRILYSHNNINYDHKP